MRRLFRYDLIWHKTGHASGFLHANRMPMRAHEHILVFYRKLPTYNPQKVIVNPNHPTGGRHARGTKQTNNNYGHFKNLPPEEPKYETHPTSILKFKRPHPPKHPTEKSVPMFSWLIKSYSNPGDVVFDGYAGSGTTMNACRNTDRKFIVCETDACYFQMIQDQYAEKSLFYEINAQRTE